MTTHRRPSLYRPHYAGLEVLQCCRAYHAGDWFAKGMMSETMEMLCKGGGPKYQREEVAEGASWEKQLLC